MTKFAERRKRGEAEAARVFYQDVAELDPKNPNLDTMRKVLAGEVPLEVALGHPSTQVTWLQLDDGLNVKGDFKVPESSTPKLARFVAMRGCVRLRGRADGRLDVMVDAEADPTKRVRLPVPPKASERTKDMVFVPPGSYPVLGLEKSQDAMWTVLPAGATREDRQASRELRAFAIDRTEVTRRAYAAFVHDGGYKQKELWSKVGWAWLEGYRVRTKRPVEGPGDGDLALPEREDEPMAGITYYEAEAYAKWAGKALPSAEQWEIAARGALGSPYPWGNVPLGMSCPRDNARPVGKGLVQDVSPLGCLDLGVNVCEWTQSMKLDHRGDPIPDRVIQKGASFLDSIKDIDDHAHGDTGTRTRHMTPRSRYDPNDSLSPRPGFGFRCVRVLSRELDFEAQDDVTFSGAVPCESAGK
jgi:formylglycine-generating enzyme required for sulfatase activity